MKLSKLFLCALMSLVGSLFRPSVNVALGAKSGTITSPSGDDANMRTLGDVQPAVGTLAGIVRQALALAVALKAVAINFILGEAVVVPTGTNVAAALDAQDVDVAYGKFTKDDPSKASSPWTWVAGAGADAEITARMEAVVAERKPSLSVESLTNACEDVQAELIAGEYDLGFVLHYDQAVGEINLRGATAAVLSAMDNLPAILPENAAFTRTVAAPGSTQFGE